MECQICFELRSVSLFIKITTNCNHELNICKLCVNNHILTHLDSKDDIEIICPFDKCDQKIQYNDVKKFVSKSKFKRFDTLIFLQTLNEIPDFRWCKNPRCKFGQIHADRERNPKMTCDACGQYSCYIHDIAWHKNSVCDGLDISTKNYINKKTKPCPRCGVRIIKNGGCNHMICTCGRQFDWSHISHKP
ncbi:hypothetical protein C1645_811993 [Glomus cerebriforme]|uniref:RBR-type E3 ubiquitin transferase n=1 Tax=Glomus cerebriforme TaxID=658196 RepID=A0A397TLB6_9GLOM|nr:hypothetical protein C1645_811993 [Glomus cerebriforme]